MDAQTRHATSLRKPCISRSFASFAYTILVKIFPTILKFQIKHIIILFAITVLSFILPLLVELTTIPTPSSLTDSSKSIFQRNLEDPIYKWLLIAPMSYDLMNVHGTYILNRSQVKINLGPFGFKELPRNVIPCLVKAAVRLVVGLVMLGSSHVSYGTFMGVTQVATYITISIFYHTVMLTHVPYPSRWKQWFTLSLGSQLLEFSMVWLPLIPISASMFMDGVGGTIAKALIACVTMFFFRYMAVSHTSKQLAATLEHDMKKGLKAINKSNPHRTLEEDHKAISEITSQERETIRYVATVSKNRVMTTRVRAGSFSSASQVLTSTVGGLEMRAGTVELSSIAMPRKSEIGAIVEDDGHTQSTNYLSKARTGVGDEFVLDQRSGKGAVPSIDESPNALQKPIVASKNVSAGNYDQTPVELHGQPSVVPPINKQAESLRNHGYLCCALFYIVNWLIVLRQNYASESYFYITAFLSCLAEFVYRLIIGRLIYMKVNQVGIDQVADIDDVEAATNNRDEVYTKLQVAASTNVLELVTHQGCLFICTLLLFLFDMPPSLDGSFKSLLTFNPLCNERITWTHLTLIYRSLFILALQNMFLYALIAFEYIYRQFPYGNCIVRLNIHLATWTSASSIIVAFTGAIMLVVRGLLYEEWDKTLLVCTLLRDNR
ncbi:hypothetical protein HDV05_007929 [Chytridiales sp. JEL 0842]|nr:hypothetical protein HDV05_007929 [Chytridiales sp. JEL 0842]